MTEYLILLKARAWGCKIKSAIHVDLTMEKEQIKQGEELILKMQINFDKNDLPKSIEISQKQDERQGFALDKPITQDVTDSELTLTIPLKYVSGNTGEYRVDVNFRHAEYGTQLAEVKQKQFTLTAPDVEIKYCRTDIPRISKGQIINLLVGFYSPAPQKIRGIVYGRMIASGDLVHKMYELEPKRISLIGEKEIVWHIDIPHDEFKTGKLNAIIEFKSKDTFSKKEFEGIVEIRQSRIIKVNRLSSSAAVASASDELVIEVELENIGLEEIDFEVSLEIFKKEKVEPNKILKSSTQRDSNETNKTKVVVRNEEKDRWILPPQVVKLTPDAKQTLSWPLKLPPEILNGKYSVILHWQDLKTKEINDYSQELFEVKKHHEVKIIDAIAASDSFSVGSEAIVRMRLSDTGTRAQDELLIDYKISDILNQEVYRRSIPIRFTEGTTELDLSWTIPDNLEGGRYDLEASVKLGDQELIKRKFSKIINIELPVKLDVHLMLPTTSKTDREIAKYLLENEEVEEKITHRNLSIYRLNSNTNLFALNDKLINYSPDEKSLPSDLQIFAEEFLSYLIMIEYLTSKKLNEELSYWSKLSYSWANLVVAGDKFLNLKGADKLKELCNQKPTLPLCSDITRIVFKNLRSGQRENVSMAKPKPTLSFELNRIMRDSVLADKQVIKTDDFKLISSILKYLVELSTPSKPQLTKGVQKSKTKPKKDNISLFDELDKILKVAIRFRKVINSDLLQKKFNKIVSNLLHDMRKAHLKRQPDMNIFLIMRTLYSYLLLFLIYEIMKILKLSKRDKNITPANFNKLVLYQNIFYIVYMHYINARGRFETYLDREKTNLDLNRTLKELRKINNMYWSFHKRWQVRYNNYLKNMVKRSNVSFIREHIKITTNPIKIHGMRGGTGRSKLILGNNGTRAVALNPYLALPSIHWNLVEPEASLVNNVYNLKRMVITPKQTKEIPIGISFPRALSFQGYTAILKLNAKPVKLIPEVN